jgi:uncharacterized membrane protein YkoI
MSNKPLLPASLATAAFLVSATAMADKPGSDWVSLEQAAAQAKAAGYTQLHGIEADDNGYWEGEGTKTDGKIHEFRIDGKSGKVIRDQLD